MQLSLYKLGTRIDSALSAKAQALANGLRRKNGVVEALASYCSVTVHYDPELVSNQALQTVIQRLYHQPHKATRAGRLIRIPVIYDGQDLVEAAQTLGLSVVELIQIHSNAVYRVFLIGFAPGLPYLGPLPLQLELPRRPIPRHRVDAGSVAIAGRQATVYPLPTPSGWHILGRTPKHIASLDTDPPALLRIGDRVEFVPQPR